MPHVRLSIVLAVMAALGAVPARADETRAARIARLQAEKAATLHPYEPNKAERLATRVEKALTARPRAYVWLGNVYRGGLLAAGPGFRQPFRDTGLFDVHAAISLRAYSLVESSVHLPAFWGGRVQIAGDASWLDARRVAFYGVGNDSPSEGRVRFAYKPTTVGARAQIRVAGPLSAGAGVAHLGVDSDTSSRDAFGEDAALFDERPSWIRSSAFAVLDWRPSPAYARRGGFVRVAFDDYAQRTGSGYAFRLFEAEASQLVPILRENWVIALRARVTTTDTDRGNDVPFYLLPSLGGGSSVRGYHSWRFRDRNALLLNAEYRWTPSHYLDVALFADAGKVAPRAADLDFNRMHTGYGIGARFHTPSAMVLRVDLGRSSEGYSLHWSTSHRF